MRLTNLLFLAGGAWIAWKLWRDYQRKNEIVQFKEKLPPGTKVTGRSRRTHDSRKPGDRDEVVGFAIRDWLQVRLPDGRIDWAEVKVSLPGVE